MRTWRLDRSSIHDQGAKVATTISNFKIRSLEVLAVWPVSVAVRPRAIQKLVIKPPTPSD
jgi:hypothetical protein